MTHAGRKDIPLGDKYSITIIMSIHKRVTKEFQSKLSERRDDSPRGPKRNALVKRREEKEETTCGRIRGNEER